MGIVRNTNMGKKIPQQGGNSHLGIRKPPTVSGNAPPGKTSAKKDSGIGGNYVPGAKFNR